MDEQILVLEQADLIGILSGEGLVPAAEESFTALLQAARFVPRRDAEGNPELRQIIPYVVLLQKGTVFAVERLNSQSESRLHGRLSVGIGGHLNESSIQAGAMRELHEELDFDNGQIGPLIFHGFINDLSNAVSRDHLGCLYTVEASGSVAVRERDKMHGSYQTSAFLQANRERLENWSAIALDFLLKEGLLRRESED